MAKNTKIPMVRLKMVEDGALYSETSINCPEAAVKLMRERLTEMDRECVMVLTCDTKLRPINVSIVSIGTLDQSLVTGREVFKTAILSNASSIMLMHNHPSGDPTPSEEDFRITEAIRSAGTLLGIRLLDHIITARGGYYSFLEQNQLNAETALQKVAE